MKLSLSKLALLSSLGAACGASYAQQPFVWVGLDFEGVLASQDGLYYPNAKVLEFYNGGLSGAGTTFSTNLGVTFSLGAIAAESDDGLDTDPPTRHGDGNFPVRPDAEGGRAALLLDPALFNGSTSTSELVLSFAQGFNTGFSYVYSSAVVLNVQLFSGEGGTGDLLATGNAQDNSANCGSDNFLCVWEAASVSLAAGQTARSVRISGVGAKTGFDLVTFGRTTPGAGFEVSPIPEPSTYALMGLGLAGVAAAARRRRANKI